VKKELEFAIDRLEICDCGGSGPRSRSARAAEGLRKLLSEYQSTVAQDKEARSTAPKKMSNMTEPELGIYMTEIMDKIKAWQAPDVLGCMLVVFQEDSITQYAASVEPEGAIDALRELADRLERRETVKREPDPDLTPDFMADILSLVVEREVPRGVILSWPPERWMEIVEWAGAVHMSASDNEGIVVPETPPEVKDYL
jgi:hypothetical protein